MVRQEKPGVSSRRNSRLDVYLHFTLDLWFEKKFKSQCRGEAYLVRFADNFVGCFQFQDDAQNFQRQLRER